LKTFLLALALLLTGFQTSEYRLYKSFSVPHATFFSSDNIGNVYVVAEDVLYQYNASGQLMTSYNERKFGHLSFVDTSNPLKMLLFYPDFAQVVVLDNRLTVKRIISFRELNIGQPGLICNSYNDGIWVFDQQQLKLRRLDPTNKIEVESNTLGQVVEDTLAPNFMLEMNNMLYLNNPSTGILVFDVYGTYYKTLPFTGLRSFQIIGDQLLYFRYTGGRPELKSYHLKTIAEKNILLPPVASTDSISDVRIAPQKLYVFKKEILDLYSF
jgi:hypothetical protein